MFHETKAIDLEFDSVEEMNAFLSILNAIRSSDSKFQVFACECTDDVPFNERPYKRII